jgi:electron transfer flavoprotein beta subunit
MTLSVVVLASVGFHTVSRRPCVAAFEASALALARTIPGAVIGVIHAGSGQAAEQILRDLVGMGAARATLLDIPPGADPIGPLLAQLARIGPDIVLAGSRAECGEASGMVPFVLAERLGWPLVTAATAVRSDASEAELVQAIFGGRRRRLAVSLPVLVTVDDRGPPACLSAIGRARRAQISTFQIGGEPDVRRNWTAVPARLRPKRLSGPRGQDDGALAAGGKQVLRGIGADDAATTIIGYLRREGLIRISG